MTKELKSVSVIVVLMTGSTVLIGAVLLPVVVYLYCLALVTGWKIASHMSSLARSLSWRTTLLNSWYLFSGQWRKLEV